MDETTTCTPKSLPVICRRRKTNTVILPRTCSIEQSKILSQGFIREIEHEFILTWAYHETSEREDERLPNKSIKELKAENKELAELKKSVCLLKLKSKNEEKLNV